MIYLVEHNAETISGCCFLVFNIKPAKDNQKDYLFHTTRFKGSLNIRFQGFKIRIDKRNKESVIINGL